MWCGRLPSRQITSGQSNLTQGRITAVHGSFNRIRQVAPMCTASNTWFLGSTRVCLKTASWSVQPFCWAHLWTQHANRLTTVRATCAAIGRICDCVRCRLKQISYCNILTVHWWSNCSSEKLSLRYTCWLTVCWLCFICRRHCIIICILSGPATTD